ncbi:hypothetical protein ACYSNX_07500 [Myroides sp. LJL115]
MRNVLYVLSVFVFSFFMQSCQLKEEIKVNKKGEIDYTYLVDFSAMVDMMGQSAVEKMVSESKDFFNQPPVSLEQVLASKGADEKSKEQLDSIYKVHPNLKQLAKKVKMSAVMQENTGQIYFTFKSDNYKQLNEDIRDLQQIFQADNSGNSQGSANDQMWVTTASEYFYNQKKFTRKLPTQADQQLSQELSTMGNINMMEYQIKMSFDQVIKSVSYPEARISSDGKSFTHIFSLQQVFENPKVLEFEVEFK